MCGLCGVFGIAGHWSDDFGKSNSSLAAERQHRISVANKLLGIFGLKLASWGARYTLSSSTGRTAVVNHLGEVWPTAERLLGRPLDPLDEAVIACIEPLSAQR